MVDIERIEPEAVPISELWKEGLERADEILKQVSTKAKAAISVSLIAAMVTTSQAKIIEGDIETPITSSSEDKKTTLEVRQAQVEAPKIVVPTEAGESPEYIRRLPAQATEAYQEKLSSEGKVATKANYFYEVKEGDSLSSIAQKFGIEWPRIAEENKIPKPEFIIHPGEVLTIPLTGIFVPATENFIPSESILLRTAKEANLGINFLNNEILPSYGLNELTLPLVDPQKDIKFLPYVGKGKEALPASTSGKEISIYMLDVGEIAWVGEELTIDHSRQDPIRRRREIWKIIHEDVHRAQRRFEYADEFYEKDEGLTEALENITEYITFISTTPYRQKENGWGSAKEGTLPGTAWRVKQVEAWIKELNESGLDGVALILEYGLRGDMEGFEKLYDSYISKGTFRSTVMSTH